MILQKNKDPFGTDLGFIDAVCEVIGTKNNPSLSTA